MVKEFDFKDIIGTDRKDKMAATVTAGFGAIAKPNFKPPASMSAMDEFSDVFSSVVGTRKAEDTLPVDFPSFSPLVSDHIKEPRRHYQRFKRAG